MSLILSRLAFFLLELTPLWIRRFNAALSGEPERTIVTSTGPFIVAWNFRQVKSGNISNYTLRRFSEDVVADNFKFGGDRDIVSISYTRQQVLDMC